MSRPAIDRTDRSAEVARSRHRAAALIAAVAVVVAIVWGLLVVWDLGQEIDDFPRADIPGAITAELEADEPYVVYYERRAWFVAAPTEVDLQIVITGPDGDLVPVTLQDGTEGYRLPRLVGQAEAAFEPVEQGEHTITVDGLGIDDGATAAVGPTVTRPMLGGLARPVAVLLAGLGAAALVAVSARALARPEGARPGGP
jgi:hypothetical protein